ncbi:MAG: hypothetical protein HYZ89_03375 [Candidatus Omnitrophica bacterium]|nr:hypothetical protein [Candidatus Omnitrophota bacterium]
MTHAWILTALGKDQPGIVARLTKILYEQGCNLEDSAMTRLAGEFAIMLIFSADSSVSQRRLEQACKPLSRDHQLIVYLKALTRAELTRVSRGTPYLLSVYGADRPGIVYRVSTLLARLSVNITDVATHLSAVAGRRQAGRTAGKSSRRAASLYLMLLEVELPPRLRASRLEQQLRTLARQLGVDVTLRSAETSVL